MQTPLQLLSTIIKGDKDRNSSECYEEKNLTKRGYENNPK